MFHIDVTIEDQRIIAVENENTHMNGSMDVTFIETNMGIRVKKTMGILDLMRVLSVAATLDGQSEVHTTYEQANELLGDFGGDNEDERFDRNQCRPIP